jgi:PAS domain S-box-containing protein
MSNPARILIVEDDDAVRAATRLALQSAGYETIEAADGEEGVRLAGLRQPDLILMDVNLPKLNGLEAMRRIKATPATASAFVIIVSGSRVDAESQAHGLETGADSYLTRPISNRELVARIQAMLRIKAAEDATRQMDRQLQTLVANNLDGMLVVDQKGKALFANPAACELLNLPAQTIEGQDIRLPMTVGEHAELDLRRADGQMRTVEMRTGAFEWHGQPALLTTLRDVTERVDAQRVIQDQAKRLQTQNEQLLAQAVTLVASETRFRQLAENIQEVFWLRDAASGQMLYVSPAYETVWGRTCASLYEHPRSFTESVYPADLDRVRAAQLALQNQSQPFSEEYRIIRPDGTVRWVWARTFAIRDEAGQVYRYAGIAEDITERKQTEEALMFLVQSGWVNTPEGFFGALARYLAEHLGMDYVCIDRLLEEGQTAQTVAVYFDRLFENNVTYSLKDTPCGTVVGKTVCCFPQNVRHLFPLDRVLQDMPAESYVGTTLWSSGGQPIGLIAVIGRRPLENPQLAESLLNLVAVRAAGELERQQAEEKIRAFNTELEQRVAARTMELTNANTALRRASRMKDEFLATMSHELRTPLTAVQGLTEALQMGVYGAMNEKQLRALSIVRESGQHLLDLITDILDLSKLEAGKLELQPEWVSVQDTCQASLRFVRQLAQKKNLRVSVDIDPQANAVYADGRRLKQMLVNLLSNAVKFTPAGGEVGLKVEGDRVQPVIRFVVWDNGIGIAPEDLPRLFQPFTQLDSRLARQYEGTGLGLSLVHRLAELHNGEVTAESEGELGKGSRFVITLPWRLTDAPAWSQTANQPVSPPWLPPPESPATQDAASESAVLLLVDDNETTLMALSGFLLAKGYDTHTAQNGAHALLQAQARQPDVILLDIQMPGMDGLEVIRQLRAHPTLGTVPIIAITALAMPDDRERCLAAGATDYLPKPVQLNQLHQHIQRLLNKTVSD